MAVLVIADDLIWASRLRAAVERAGAAALVASNPARAREAAGREPVEAVIVDLNGRTYDGVDEVRAATEAGRRVLAVGQHEDLELRQRALAAGARRVYSYNKLFRDGPTVVAALIADTL